MSDAASHAGADQLPLIIGRYALFDVIASGGMATVHLGRLLGSVGFGRTVAVKRLHTHYTSDPDFVTMFMDEARIVARIRHPNVVPMVDVIESSKGLFLIMEYVHGESFSKLLRTTRVREKEDKDGKRISLKLLNSVMHGVLLGLHAAHETKGTKGELLDVVHRDVSPQNIIVGADGTARVLDFGVAKAAGRAQVTREGQIKGKLAYMAPEQIRGKVDRRADVFAAAVVFWEALAGRRLHEGAKDVEIVTRVVQGKFPKPSEFRADIPPELDAIVLRGLEIDPEKRYPNAREMAIDIERKVGLAPPSEVGEWVERLAPEALRLRAEKVAAMEKAAQDLVPDESVPPPALEGADAGSGSGSGSGSKSGSGSGQRPSDPNLPRAQLPSIPAPQDMTMLMDEAPARPPPSSDASMPSSSGAHDFIGDTTGAHTNGTPMGQAFPLPDGAAHAKKQKDLAPLIAVVSFLGALALVGAVLGALSLYAQHNNGLSAASKGTASSSSSSPPSILSVAPIKSASPSTTSSARDSAIAIDAGSTTAATATTTAAAPAYHPPPKPQTPPPPPPQPKKNCDPPYTVDEAGHRHYKLDCMPNE